MDHEPQRNLQPIVSTANVGQLAADLLISSLDLRRIGIFNPKDLVPVVGAREDNESGVTTPLERSSTSSNPYRSYPHHFSLRQTGHTHRRDTAKVPCAQGTVRSYKTDRPLIVFASESQG